MWVKLYTAKINTKCYNIYDGISIIQQQINDFPKQFCQYVIRVKNYPNTLFITEFLLNFEELIWL